MATTNDTFQQALTIVSQLSPIEKLRLIEHLTPDIEIALQTLTPIRRRSLRGILKGSKISASDIDHARQEMREGFPKGAL